MASNYTKDRAPSEARRFFKGEKGMEKREKYPVGKEVLVSVKSYMKPGSEIEENQIVSGTVQEIRGDVYVVLCQIGISGYKTVEVGIQALDELNANSVKDQVRLTRARSTLNMGGILPNPKRK